jgi:hypothetical protein
LRLVIPASAMVRRVFALTGIDRVIPNFPGQSEALGPAPAAAARPPRRRRRTKPGMRARADRPPRDPGASTQPGLMAHPGQEPAWAAAGSRAPGT